MDYKFFLYLVVVGVVYIAGADGSTIILQNGLNEYTGCEDTYIGTSNYTISENFVPGSNHHDEPELLVHKESC